MSACEFSDHERGPPRVDLQVLAGRRGRQGLERPAEPVDWRVPKRVLSPAGGVVDQDLHGPERCFRSIGTSCRNKTKTDAIKAPMIPTQKVEASAIENASWMPRMMLSMRGSTVAFASAGTLARIRSRRLPVPVMSTDPPTRAKPAANSGGTPTFASWAGISVN